MCTPPWGSIGVAYIFSSTPVTRIYTFHHLQKRRFRVLAEQEAKGKQRALGVSAAGGGSTKRGSEDDMVNADLVLETEEGVIRATSRQRASAGSGISYACVFAFYVFPDGTMPKFIVFVYFKLTRKTRS